jgi:clan AA aspartic protease (TIGR02281 family)
MEKHNGVYKLECKINGIPMNFIFDTGASSVSISSTEARFLIKQGLITDEDVIGNVNYKIANGETLEGTKVNIKKIEIKGLILENVTATIVHELNAPLLLGQSVLSRLGKITIDGNNLIIHNNNVESDISAIEESGTYSETLFGIENNFKVEIDYNSDTRKVVYKKTSDELNVITIWEITFNLNDIIKTSMEHNFWASENDLYNIWIDFKTKDKTIEWKTTEYKKGKKYTAITNKEFKDFMVITANNNDLPKAYLEKYLNNWKSFLGIETSKEKVE